jgi:cephalosporin-C deacetylase
MKIKTNLTQIKSGLLIGLFALPIIAHQGMAETGQVKSGLPKVVAAGRSVAKVTTDRACALYTCNDKAVFSVSLLTDGKPVEEGICHIKLKYDGVEAATEKDYDLTQGNPFKIEASLDHPGFIKCDFMGVDKMLHIRTRGAAGFDVEKIRQGQPEPPDFDQYWAQLLKRQAAIPNAVTCEPLPDTAGKPGYKYFKLSVTTIDEGKVYGFLGVPAGNPGPFPAIVLIAGAGAGYDGPDSTFIRPDLMTLSINIHPIDPSLPQAEFQKRYKELTSSKDYWLQGAPDRDKYYFRNAILGANAAVEWLVAHPQFNQKGLFYLGASQGGGFGLILAGLNPKFSTIAVSVPALCDHGGIAVGRVSGWPQLVKNVATNDVALRNKALEMSGYFDAVNFAKRVKCPAIFTVGFCDATCCPSSVYAAFNVVKSPKFIMTAPLADHPVPWWHLNGIWQWTQNSLDDKYRTSREFFDW